MDKQLTCPRCGGRTAHGWCCGIDLAAQRPWEMDRSKTRAVHVLARSRKGLSDAAYRAQLARVGVTSSLQLTREQFAQLMANLGDLPDAPYSPHPSSTASSRR